MLNKVEEGIDAIRNGEIVIVVDDEDRENEGDFICAAEKVTPEIINFMSKHGRGLICASLNEERCEELGLDLMVGKNTATFETPFTISVDLIGHGCTTGISAMDRAKTIQALVNENTRPEELGRPGHIFPLKAKKEGVLRRSGHTEAAIDLPRLAGLKEGGVLVEIMKDDGTMARLPDLRKVADEFDLKLISIEDLISYRLKSESLVSMEYEIPFPTFFGEFTLKAFRQLNNDAVHIALIKGSWKSDEPVLVRVHASKFESDVLGYDPGLQGDILRQSMKLISDSGKGLILYMYQNQVWGTELLERLAQMNAEPEKPGRPVDQSMDSRDYGIGAQILRELNAYKLRLITRHSQSRAGIEGYGLEIQETVQPD